MSSTSYQIVTSADESEKPNGLEEDLKKAHLTINYLKRQNGSLKQKLDDGHRKFEREKSVIQIEKGREITKQKKDNDKLKTELNIQKKEKVKLADQFQKSLADWKSRVDSLEENLIQKEKELSRLNLELQQQEDKKMTFIQYDKQLEQLTEQYRQLQNEIEAANDGEKEKTFNSNDMGPLIVEKQDVLMKYMTTHVEQSKFYQEENRDAFQQLNAKLDTLKSSEEKKEQSVGREIQGIERTPSPPKPTTRGQVRLRRDKITAKFPVTTQKKPFTVSKVPSPQ
ncbi:RUN and FYVE domain-containing protein 2-like [Mercenaria mercenaria]|uniref:RUN and FYVE domain-containing protein 2-like n=1 Tax=Mercenaria mercenaria TaxID=6596 RepID=UPI00234F281E|nr:RUN and FYVE domain-containing protein 2-like [Mercenaria mercenaria]